MELKGALAIDLVVCSRVWDVAWHTESEENKFIHEPNALEYIAKANFLEYAKDLKEYRHLGYHVYTHGDRALESWSQQCKVAISCLM